MSSLRQIEPRWDKSMIVASLAISFLGTFTSTQLMCHARAAYTFSSVFGWALLSSLIFGFCSIWSLHEVAMLAFEFDIPIGVDGSLTFLSALLAVSFTFVAMAGDLLYDRYTHRRTRSNNHAKNKRRASDTALDSTPFLQQSESPSDNFTPELLLSERQNSQNIQQADQDIVQPVNYRQPRRWVPFSNPFRQQEDTDYPLNEDYDDYDIESEQRPSTQNSSDHSFFTKYLSNTDTNSTSFSLRRIIGFSHQNDTGTLKNPFIAIFTSVYHGLNVQNVLKGFTWSLAITSMHYVGIVSMKIPNGYYTLSPILFMFSALISWIVCTVGFILMTQMETRLSQQIIFSIIATGGVGAMHFTGMAATTFWTSEPSSSTRGFPTALASAVVGVAFMTCIVANVLLSHSATVSRNKLAEIVWTRKELYRNIALKEHAEEAARTRSEFIASASHEIRTPLHHLQGYADLLAQTDLTTEGRDLVMSIQRATKTLSLLTNNVLDWSKFEGNIHGEYRPSAVDIRGVCESIVTLLPNIEDDSSVEIYVVVSPHVPKILYLDDSWMHRILMNLLSNALKFTKAGYILLSLDLIGHDLIAIVRDTGCGLDPDFIPDMWTPFKQGEVRGSARGTGLGLSIIRQLLLRMNGSIEVESKYEHTEGVMPGESGTTFTVTVPIELSNITRSEFSIPPQKSKVAILTHNTTHHTKGLRIGWETFGYGVVICNSITDIGQEPWSYIWTELEFLSKLDVASIELLSRKPTLVLIPYDTQDTLDSLPQVLTAPNIVLLQKPLLWHTFSRRIATTRERRLADAPSQALRFSPAVQVLDGSASSINIQPLQPSRTSTSKEYTVLLVEDNAINRKLGCRMLETLHYTPLTAVDGQDALDVLARLDGQIDCILMDQSMPRMDGVTATRAIRTLEEERKIRRGRPIIAVTAVVNSDAVEEFKKAGADDFLAKPLSLNKLHDVLAAYLPR